MREHRCKKDKIERRILKRKAVLRGLASPVWVVRLKYPAENSFEPGGNESSDDFYHIIKAPGRPLTTSQNVGTSYATS